MHPSLTPPAPPPTRPPLRKWQSAALPLALDNLAEQLSGQAKPGLIAACTGAGKSRLIGEILTARVPRLLDGEVCVITTPTQRLVRQLAGTARRHLAEPIAEHYTVRKWRGSARVIICCNASAPGLSARLIEAGKRIGLWIADEAHRTETPEIYQFHTATPAAAALAVTATPYRAEEKERLRLWDALLYRYSPTEALADGVLVPWRAVPWSGEAGAALDKAALEMITAHVKASAGNAGPGVVNALSIADAGDFAAKLNRAGISAHSIHSGVSTREQDKRIEDLRTGKIQALVYPSLLCEGVDFPWLSWGCLRRPVKSRVRFTQELGRFLRTAPGKTEAVILDPLGLLEEHATRVDAALGWEKDPKPPARADSEPADITDDLAEAEGKELVARVADALGAYARNLLYLAIQDGQLDPKLAPQAATWRRQPATEKQRSYLASLARRDRQLEPDHIAMIRRVIKSGLLPSCGATGDLITLLKNLSEPWCPGSRLAPLTEDAIQRAAAAVQAEPIYVAGAQRGGIVALAVVRAGQVLETSCKVVGRGVVPMAVEIAAIRLGALTGVRIEAPRPLLVATSSQQAAARIKDRRTARNEQIHAALRAYHNAAPPHDLRTLLPSEANPAQSAAWAALARFSRSQNR